MVDDRRLREAVALLDERFGLAALYVFGSQAKGTATASSDVDLAALFARPVPALGRLAVTGDLAAVLGRDVDLVDLREASPVVAMQVLRHGRLVHERDRRVRVAFEAGTPGRYEDLVRIRQPQVDALVARVVDRDVVIAKVDALDRCLGRIASLRDRRDRLLAEDYEELVELNLQRAAQDAIDLAAHVVASEGWGVVDHVALHFAVLEARGVIDADLAARLRSMVGFRNVAVHQYTAVDPQVVERIVSDHLDDLRVFASAVLHRFGLTR